MYWQNRQQAGQKLAEILEKFTAKPNTIILGLPRGGVVVAFEIAQKLQLPLDIIVTRKIGAPGNEELALGAIDETGQGSFDEILMSYFHVDSDHLLDAVNQEKKEAKRRLELYRGHRPLLDLKDKTALLVDDGIATGYTMLAAIKSARQKEAKKVIVATPVVAADTLIGLKEAADEVYFLYAPADFGAVGRFYQEFEQTTDEEVVKMLK